MPTIGSVELLVVILVAFLVVGPRDLPRLMRTVGGWVHKMRVMAAEFQHNLDVVVKEADLEDLKNDVNAIRTEAEDMRRSLTTPLDPKAVSPGKPGVGKPAANGDQEVAAQKGAEASE